MDALKPLLLAILFAASYSRRAHSPFSHNMASKVFNKTKSRNRIANFFTSSNGSKDLKSLLNTQLRSNKSVNSSSIPIPNHLQEFHRRVLNHFQSFAREKTEQSVSDYNSVEFMMNLYNYKSGNSKGLNGKLNNVLKRSDVVRCFEAVELYKEESKWNAVFDTSAILPHERIRMAEMRLTSFDSEEEMTSLEMWDERRSQSSIEPSLIRRKIGSVSVENNKLSYQRTTSADITRTIRRWNNNKYKKNSETKNLMNEGKSEKVSKNYEESRFQRSLSSSRPTTMLFVYSTNKNIELIDVATARQGRNRRSSKRGQLRRRITTKHKHSKRKSRKKNKTERLSRRKEIRSNEVEIVFHRPQEVESNNDFKEETQVKADSDEVEEWRQKQSDVVVIKDKVPEDSNPAKRILPPTVPWNGFKNQVFNPGKPIKPRHCRKVAYTVNFEKIGWGDWIIFPKQYNAYRCVGECRIPLTATPKPTNHAFMQSLLSVNRPDSGISAPCCVPSKLQSLSILYYENGVVKQREHEDMVVGECDCR